MPDNFPGRSWLALEQPLWPHRAFELKPVWKVWVWT
jgi:hypothetical protein